MEYRPYNSNGNLNDRLINTPDIYALLAYIPEFYPTSFLHNNCTKGDFDVSLPNVALDTFLSA
jgi:hypothetical protein